MQKEDIFYLLVLVFSIPFGHILKSCGPNWQLKKLLSCATGLALAITFCGKDLFHSLIVILGTCLIVKVKGAHSCRWICFGYVFGYLFLMRMLIFYGVWGQGKYTNVTQLLVTLRMISLPFELHKMAEKKKKMGESNAAEDISGANNTSESNGIENNNNENNNGPVHDSVPTGAEVGVYDFLAYGYCYIGLMTGPFYTYRTYTDMLFTDHRYVETVKPAIHNLKMLPVFAGGYLLASLNFPFSHVGSDDYLNNEWGLVYHLLYLVPMFLGFRWRFYIAWLMAESACMTAGLGAYPVQCEPVSGGGPTKEAATSETDELAYGFQTIKNVNIRAIEFATRMEYVMKDWNTTVQWWLKTYVYRELPIRSKPLRMFALLFISAFWHGVHPGYYLTFLSVPFVVLAEKRMVDALSPHLSEKQRYWLDWATHFCLYRSFEYLGVGFILLKWNVVLKVWSHMYFIGHLFIFLFILLPFVIPKKVVSKVE